MSAKKKPRTVVKSVLAKTKNERANAHVYIGNEITFECSELADGGFLKIDILPSDICTETPSIDVMNRVAELAPVLDPPSCPSVTLLEVIEKISTSSGDFAPVSSEVSTPLISNGDGGEVLDITCVFAFNLILSTEAYLCSSTLEVQIDAQADRAPCVGTIYEIQEESVHALDVHSTVSPTSYDDAPGPVSLEPSLDSTSQSSALVSTEAPFDFALASVHSSLDSEVSPLIGAIPNIDTTVIAHFADEVSPSTASTSLVVPVAIPFGIITEVSDSNDDIVIDTTESAKYKEDETPLKPPLSEIKVAPPSPLPPPPGSLPSLTRVSIALEVSPSASTSILAFVPASPWTSEAPSASSCSNSPIEYSNALEVVEGEEPLDTARLRANFIRREETSLELRPATASKGKAFNRAFDVECSSITGSFCLVRRSNSSREEGAARAAALAKMNNTRDQFLAGSLQLRSGKDRIIRQLEVCSAHTRTFYSRIDHILWYRNSPNLRTVSENSGVVLEVTFESGMATQLAVAGLNGSLK